MAPPDPGDGPTSPPPNQKPPRRKPAITAAPKIRQVYWCAFWRDALLPEMWKTRPVLIVSFKNTLHGHCLVLPISTDPQEGESAQWAYGLDQQLPALGRSFIVCNHLYTVATARLSPFPGMPRLNEAAFDEVLRVMHKWLPSPRTPN